LYYGDECYNLLPLAGTNPP